MNAATSVSTYYLSSPSDATILISLESDIESVVIADSIAEVVRLVNMNVIPRLTSSIPNNGKYLNSSTPRSSSVSYS
jgi:hypothetical protein